MSRTPILKSYSIGWVIVCGGVAIVGTNARTRRRCIELYDKIPGPSYDDYRKRGIVKAIKVRLVPA